MIITMKTRSFLSVLLLAVPLLCLTGCLKKKKTEKKMAQVGRGFDLSGSKKGSKKYGKDLEAFVLDDQDEESMKTVSTTGQKQLAWKEEKSGAKAFEPVFFSFDRYDIRPDQQEAVKLDVEQGKTAVAQGKMLKVEGHADKHYVSELYNLAISQKRAHTMVNALADAGVDKAALKAVGFGATKPAVDAPGKIEANRRAEIIPLSA
jgi:outer membrane protein OmpA-like peptidoglycan-associated protein